ncbi:MAG: TonB C-terminal domain-containing protein [Pseudomonadota bacterium]
MRVGVFTSTVAHALLLGWGLVSWGAPEAFDVEDVEALPIDLVSIEEFTQIQEGSQEAPKDGPAAPDQVINPEPRQEAENIGPQEQDQTTPETEEQLAVEVEEARLPEPVETETPEPTPRPDPEPTPAQPEETPAAPATEVAPEPELRQEIAPDPVEEVIEAAEPEPTPEEEFVTLPEDLPVPAARPERPPAQTAQTPERENRDAQEERLTQQQPTNDDQASEDIASLINRDRGSGGGAASSTEQASRGGETTTGGTTLTQSEMDSLRGQIQACWNPPAGVLDASDLRVSVRFSLDESGKLSGRPQVTASSGNRQADESAIRAVQRCNIQNDGFQLPADKFAAWRDVVVNFDPSEMF